MTTSMQELLDLRKQHIPQGPFNITPTFIREDRKSVV
jgi:hypothetical protein